MPRICEKLEVKSNSLAHLRFAKVSFIGLLLTIAVATANLGCNLGSQMGATSVSKPQSRITIAPSDATITAQGVEQFSATITGTSNTAVRWYATAGTISSNGMFTAPQVSSRMQVTVTAIGAPGSAAVPVNVIPVPSLAITTDSLSQANAGVPYNYSLSASGGTPPYRWSLDNGLLPEGIQLQASGVLAGTTALNGSYSFGAKVSDASGSASTRALRLSVSAKSMTGFDGPAELPRVFIQTATANTPAPGKTISVNAGGDFQSALNTASCGDTIQLQAGATFAGAFKFPAKSCDNNHWIIIRTNAPDSALPPEGTRLTPCYAGVSSLPARPAFQCASTKNVLAKLIMPEAGVGPIVFDAGASYYRFMGLEITRTAGTGVVYALASIDPTGTANNLIFDRVWMHGTTHDETTRGVALGRSTYVSVVDSFLTDFHCVAITGACIDAQAINGGLGNDPMGPYKIVDNFLEASGENILFGGGEATLSPADIEIRHNHMFKPMTWMQGQPGYVGGPDGHPFIVKNLFELKSGQRVLLEGNILENSWGGFSQAGWGIVLTPKNQMSATGNVCPNCQVTDITIRYTTVSHVGGGIVMGNGRSGNGGVPRAGGRYSIHDVTIDDISGTKYAGFGAFAQVSMGPGTPVLQDVTVNHVTAFPQYVMLYLGDDTRVNRQMSNFVFTNNIVNATPLPTETVGGGPTNCAYYSAPVMSLPRCFLPYTFSHNAFIATPGNFPPSKYPTGNFFPSTAANVNFSGYRDGIGGNYTLQAGSPFKNAGTDGKDLGADLNAIQAAIAGVE